VRNIGAIAQIGPVEAKKPTVASDIPEVPTTCHIVIPAITRPTVETTHATS
jgi:hypothetical protein